MSRQPDAKGPSDPATDATQTSEFARSDVSAGDVIAGRYRIERLVGMGAMGQVYEAFDQHLETRVAAKLLRPDLAEDATALERFRQELLVARKVSHPNVIRLHDMVRDGDHWLISMDYVDGETLEQRLSRDGKLSTEEAVAVCRQIAAGLAAAHRVGVIHRDLKPGNILIDQSGQAFISDFGIARSVSQAGLTRQGVLIGTPDYLSPEQAAGDPVDGRSDLYSLGIILCEMLTGRLPFNATTTQEAVSQRLARSATPLDARRDGIPPWLVNLCHRLLRRNPRRRYQSADEVVAELEPSPSGRRPARWLSIGGALAAGLIAIAAYVVWSRYAPPAGSAGPPSAQRIVVLPAVGVEDPSTAWATAAYVTDHLSDLDTPAPIGTLRMRTTLARLALAPDRVPDHVASIAEELGQPQLVLPRYGEGEAITLEIFNPEQGYESPSDRHTGGGESMLSALAEATAALRRGLGAPADGGPMVSDSWQAITDFYAGLSLLEQGNAMAALDPLTAATVADPDSYAAWWALSRAYEALGRWDEAHDAAFKAGSNASGQGVYAQLARARQATAAGDYPAAREIIEALATSYPHDNTLKTQLAELVGEGGEIEAAIGLLHEVTADDPEHVRAWFLLAKYSILSGDSRQALDDYLVKAMVIQNRLENRQGQADVTNAMGVAFERLGQSEQAAQHYQRAVEIREAIGDRRGEASTLRNLAAIEAIRGNPEAAQSYLDRARELLVQLDDQEGLAALYNDIGFLAEERGAYQAALEAYRNSLRLRRQLPDERALAESLSNVGYAFYQLGQFENAEAYWTQANTIFGKIGDAYNEVHLTQQLALLDWVRGRWDQAVTRLEQTLHRTEAQQMPEERAVTLGLMAQVHFSTGAFAAALDAAGRARALFEQRNDQRGVLEMQILAGNLYLALGDSDLAAAAMEDANLTGANQEQAAKLDDLRARIRLAAGDLTEAQDAVVRATERARASGSASTQLAVALTAAEIAGSLGNDSAWQGVLQDADELAHVPLQLSAYRTAIAQALPAGRELLDQRFEKAWSMVQERRPTRHEPWLTAMAARWCPIAHRDCRFWEDQLQQSLDRALDRIPEDHRDAYRASVVQAAREAPVP